MCNILIYTYTYYGSSVMNDDNYRKLNNDPLLFVLAEFRFSDVINIKKFIPMLQDRFRKELPFHEEQTSQEVNVNPHGLDIRESLQWAFLSQNRKSGIVLSHNRLVYMTSEYDRFEGFKQSCKNAVSILAEEVGPSLLVRIGLRYADLIVKKENEDITQYVQKSIYEIQHLNQFGTPMRHVNETLIKTEEGYLNIRSMFNVSNVSTWSDVGSFPIKINTVNESSERVLLDFDHFWEPEKQEDSLSFDTDIIINKLEKMHEPTRKAFWDSTTDLGREIWE